jgi:hypothetical protein
MIIPMARPLRSHTESLPAGDAAGAPLHPRTFASFGSASQISKAFADLRYPVIDRSHAFLRVSRAGELGLTYFPNHLPDWLTLSYPPLAPFAVLLVLVDRGL